MPSNHEENFSKKDSSNTSNVHVHAIKCTTLKQTLAQNAIKKTRKKGEKKFSGKKCAVNLKAKKSIRQTTLVEIF